MGFSLSGTSATCVSGREFSMLSVSTIMAWKTSDVSLLLSRMIKMIRLAFLINRSHAPPKCGPYGGLNFQTVFSKKFRGNALIVETTDASLQLFVCPDKCFVVVTQNKFWLTSSWCKTSEGVEKSVRVLIRAWLKICGTCDHACEKWGRSTWFAFGVFDIERSEEINSCISKWELRESIRKPAHW